MIPSRRPRRINSLSSAATDRSRDLVRGVEPSAAPSIAAGWYFVARVALVHFGPDARHAFSLTFSLLAPYCPRCSIRGRNSPWFPCRSVVAQGIGLINYVDWVLIGDN